MVPDSEYEKFSSLTDLYNHLLPALRAKRMESSRIEKLHIEEIDIWNYLKSTKWNKMNNLEIFEMVDDVLNVDALKVCKYVRENTKDYKKLIDWNEYYER